MRLHGFHRKNRLENALASNWLCFIDVKNIWALPGIPQNKMIKLPPAYVRRSIISVKDRAFLHGALQAPTPAQNHRPRLAKIIAAIVLLVSSQARALPLGTWTQTFNDDFNGTSLNTGVWSTGYRWSPVVNNELEAMRPENVTVANGVCNIKIEKRTCQNQDMWGNNGQTMNYASGALTTYNKWTYTYGYIEARVKMATAKGTWPAFWTLPDRGSPYDDLYRTTVGNTVYYPDGHTAPCPLGNEVDIFEYMGTWKNPSTGLSKSHLGYFWNYNTGGSNGRYAEVNQLLNPDTAFHTYGVYWEPNKFVFYIDDAVVAVYTNSVGVCPQYILLNCALSTDDWSGTPVPIADIDASLPASMQIDYVRVYRGTLAPPSEEVGSASWSSTRIDAFIKGSNQTMSTRSWNGSAWSSWTSLGQSLSAGPAVTSLGVNRLDLFYTGTNTALKHMWYNNGSWSAAEDLGGTMVGGPAATAWSSNRLDTFIRGTDSQLYWKYWNGSVWSGYTSLSGILGSSPAVTNWGVNQLDVFYAATDGSTRHKWYNGSWSAGENLGGVAVGGPAAAAWAPGRIDLFVRGTDNRLWQKSWNGSSWSGWSTLGTYAYSNPTVSSRGTGLLDLFYKGQNNAMKHMWYDAGGWHPEEDLGGVIY